MVQYWVIQLTYSFPVCSGIQFNIVQYNLHWFGNKSGVVQCSMVLSSIDQSRPGRIQYYKHSRIQSAIVHCSLKQSKVVKGGVHSSRIKCKNVQLTQKTGTIANFLKNVEEHPPNKNIGCSLTFFSTFLYSGGCSHTFFRKWASFYQLICVT